MNFGVDDNSEAGVERIYCGKKRAKNFRMTRKPGNLGKKEKCDSSRTPRGGFKG